MPKNGVMIKLGDKVKFLNDVGGGVVTRIINKDTVAVENEDGFESNCKLALHPFHPPPSHSASHSYLLSRRLAFVP